MRVGSPSSTAINVNNKGCYQAGNCDTQSFGAWSPIQTETQPAGTPDRPATQSITSTGSTTIELSWSAPDNTGPTGPSPRTNGPSVTEYKMMCADTGSYLTESWRQPEVSQTMTPGSGSTLTHTVTDYTRIHFAGSIPKGEGEVYNTTKVHRYQLPPP